MNGVYLLNSSHRTMVDQLRFQQLLDGGMGFVAESSAVKWSESDEKGIVLGLFHQSQLVATMRAEVLSSPAELVPKLDFDVPEDFVSYPCGLLGKAATIKKMQGRGLNTYLRLLAFELLMEKNIRHVVGTVTPDAPRVQLMKDLGYEFCENENGWHRYGYKSRGKTLVGRLDLKSQGTRAVVTLKLKTGEAARNFPRQF